MRCEELEPSRSPVRGNLKSSGILRAIDLRGSNAPDGRKGAMHRTKARRSREQDSSICENIIKAAKENGAFRKTVAEGYISEVALMSVLPGDSIGRVVHEEADEIFFIIQGKAILSMGGHTREVGRHDVILVQSGEPHDLRNIGHKDLKLLCICAPPSTGTSGMHQSGKNATEEQLQHAWEQ